MENIKIKVDGGWLVATPSPDPEYPGIDVEFVANNDKGEFVSNPRILVEQPKGGKLRALIWNDREQEDYTDKIEFENVATGIRTASFSCDEDLEQYEDSMLFDSGTIVANGRFEKNGHIIDIDLRVCGEVCVFYKEDKYVRASEFPEELIEYMKENPNDWDLKRDDIYVDSNNWFEYVWYIDGENDGNGQVADAPFTKESIHAEMLDIANCLFAENGI